MCPLAEKSGFQMGSTLDASAQVNTAAGDFDV